MTLLVAIALAARRCGTSANRSACGGSWGEAGDVVEHIKIHGASLEGNLEGDAVDRE